MLCLATRSPIILLVMPSARCLVHITVKALQFLNDDLALHVGHNILESAARLMGALPIASLQVRWKMIRMMISMAGRKGIYFNLNTFSDEYN